MTRISPVSETLLPCPFCGGEARVGGDDGLFYVSCCSDHCYCAVGEGYDACAMPKHIFYEEEVAIEAWNMRADGLAQTPALTDALKEVDRLRAGLESIVNCRNPLTRAAVREACAEILAASPSLSSTTGNSK